MFYELKIGELSRKLNFIDINDKLAFASFVILGDTELVEYISPLLAEKIKDVDILLTAEAKGIPLVYEISKLLGHKEFIVARKSVKSYMKDVIFTEVNSITTAETQTLYLNGMDASKIKGKNICIIDDVISTGESLNALERLAIKVGAYVKYKAAILAEGDAANREDILFLEKLPIFEKINDNEYKEV